MAQAPFTAALSDARCVFSSSRFYSKLASILSSANLIRLTGDVEPELSAWCKNVPFRADTVELKTVIILRERSLLAVINRASV